MQPVALPSAAPTTVLLKSPFIENIQSFPPNVVTSPIFGPTKAGAQAEEALIQHGSRGNNAFIMRSRVDACHGRTGGLAEAAVKARFDVVAHPVWCSFERLLHSLGLGRRPNIADGKCLYEAVSQYCLLCLTLPNYTPMQLRNMVANALFKSKGLLSQNTTYDHQGGKKAYSRLYGIDLYMLPDDTMERMGFKK
jgi:hypothetical protein